MSRLPAYMVEVFSFDSKMAHTSWCYTISEHTVEFKNFRGSIVRRELLVPRSHLNSFAHRQPPFNIQF
jgi:membrane protein YdbS with pleckstrin-like domain